MKGGSVAIGIVALLIVSGLFGLISMMSKAQPRLINLSCPQANITIPQAVCNCPEAVTVTQTTTKVYTSHFQQIIDGCSIQKPYVKGAWDCDRMSNECSKRLRHAGYPCHTQVGWLVQEGKKEAHAWVECGHNDDFLIVEPTRMNNQIVPPWEWENYITK